MTSDLFIGLLILFASLFVIGTAACLPLFGWQPKRLFASKLWVKIVWWLPIFAIFLLLLLIGIPATILLVFLLATQAWHEYLRQDSRSYALMLYPLAVTIGLLTLLPFFRLIHQAPNWLAFICFSSVLSDVIAFFLGSFAGRHHLPAFINPGKSYEGVAGQIIGAIVGGMAVSSLPAVSFDWTLALIIGIASAIGDLVNSMVKRQLDIKDWGQTIPGHGGVLDRFASLSFALAASFTYLLLVQ